MNFIIFENFFQSWLKIAFLYFVYKNVYKTIFLFESKVSFLL